MDQTENLSLKIYPNPVYDLLTIELEEEITSVNIISLDGRILLNESTKNIIDVSSLSAGIYFVEVKTDRNSYRKKIVKTN
jgi:hypothetical protein